MFEQNDQNWSAKANVFLALLKMFCLYLRKAIFHSNTVEHHRNIYWYGKYEIKGFNKSGGFGLNNIANFEKLACIQKLNASKTAVAQNLYEERLIF